jgi:phosphotransferase system enzyme I (PtsI)
MPIAGIVVSSGIAFGEAKLINTQVKPVEVKRLPRHLLPLEQQELQLAISRLCQHLSQCQQQQAPDSDAFALIEADILLLEDDELHLAINQYITDYGFCASVAVDRVFTHQADELALLDDPYLANRSGDIRCLGMRLINALAGNISVDFSDIDKDTIIFAHDLTPAEFGQLPHEFIKGLILQTGSLTSHTAILARSAGIVTLVNCPWEPSQVEDGQSLIIDAIAGKVHLSPSPDTKNALIEKYQQEQQRRLALAQYKDCPSHTLDGHKIKVRANVGELNDILRVSDSGAAGVGLFRTEFLLMHAKQIPDENSQYHLYCDALHSLKGEPLTIRTFDIGADKEMPCLTLPKEDNPALGLRGIRYSLANPNMLRVQLKAVLRAANHGRIRLMFPMLNQVEELDEILAHIEACKACLEEEEKGFGDISLGVVVETPAAVLNLPSMLDKLDFVSIGSNDLSQYTLAVDRGNASLTSALPPLSPAVLALIAMTINYCHERINEKRITVSLCGELASEPTLVPLLVGLGLDELSVNLSHVLAVKAVVCQGNFKGVLGFESHAKEALTQNRNQALTQCISKYHGNSPLMG